VFFPKVFVPLLSNERNHEFWPASIGHDVKRHVHALKNTVYQVKGQVSGQTILPMPVGVERVHEAEAKLSSRHEHQQHRLKID
jgi:dynein heavy chain, axonemal